MKFSIVIANWNGRRFLDGLFDSFERQTRRDFRIHFVDNGSVDGSREAALSRAGRLDVNVIRLDRNHGFAHANNLGIEAAQADDSEYVITLNNDIELADDCLERLGEAVEANPDVGYFQLLMVNFFDRTRIDAAGIEFNENLDVRQVGLGMPVAGLDPSPRRVQGVCAGAAAYSKRALDAVRESSGCFDGLFFAYYEDVDLSLRLIASGFKGLFIPSAMAFHVHSGTGGGDSAFKAYYLARNSLLCKYKNMTAAEYRSRGRAIWVPQLKLLLRRLLALRPDLFLAGFRGCLSFIAASRRRDHAKASVLGGLGFGKAAS